MASLNQNKPMLDLLKEEKKGSFVKSLSSIKHEMRQDAMSSVKHEMKQDSMSNVKHDMRQDSVAIVGGKDIKEPGYGAADNTHVNKRAKFQPQTGGSTLEKLEGFFKIVQEQHPESRLELQHVDGSWKVWCGACKKHLRTDKSGKAIHNIQRQHFASSRHKKKLHLMLQAEEEVPEGQKKSETK